MRVPSKPSVQTALSNNLSAVVGKAKEETRAHVLEARQRSADGNPGRKNYDPRVQSYYDTISADSENLGKARKSRNR